MVGDTVSRWIMTVRHGVVRRGLSRLTALPACCCYQLAELLVDFSCPALLYHILFALPAPQCRYVHGYIFITLAFKCARHFKDRRSFDKNREHIQRTGPFRSSICLCMPPKKNKGIHSRPTSALCTSSVGDPALRSLTVCSTSAETCVLALESPTLSLSSAPDPPRELRLLLASEASDHSLSGIARAYLQCLLTSSVPDDLRTPAIIVLLGAECPSCRADRFLHVFSPPIFHYISNITHAQVFEVIVRAAFCQGCFCH